MTRTLAVLLVLSTLLACGAPATRNRSTFGSSLGPGQRPQHDQAKRQALPQGHRQLRRSYPGDSYLVGTGEAATRSEAEARARADVAKQIDSDVSSELIIVAQKHGDEEFDDLIEKIRETSRFAYGAIIKIDRKQGACRAEGCHAVAVLERAKAKEFLNREYTRLSDIFRANAANATKTRDDPVSFAGRLADARDVYADLSPLALQTRVVAGQDPARYLEDERALLDLLQIRREVVAGLRVTIVRRKVEPVELWNPLGNALVSAFTKLGINIATGKRCARGLRFDVDASISCAPGYFGPRCDMSLSGTLRRCKGGSEIAPVDLSATNVSGAHPRSEAVATKQVFEKLGSSDLSPVLREQLGGVLPVR